MEDCRRVAMDLRMPVRGMSVSVRPVAPEIAADAVELVPVYFSTSVLTIRPLGPVPLTDLRGTPFSRARTLAAGEAMNSRPSRRSREVWSREPVEVDSSAAGGVGSEGGGGLEDSEDEEGLESDWKEALPPASSIVKFSKAETSAASSTMTAIGVPTLTSFSPVCRRILARTPSS